MPSYISLDFRCPSCSHAWWDTVDRAELAREGFSVSCPKCQSPGRRVPSAPNLTGAASYLDGQERPGWKAIKEKDRLENAMLDMKPEEKQRARQEIDKIDKVIPKGPI